MNLYIAIAIVGWGLFSFGAKVASNHIHPLWLQTINYSVGFLVVPVLLLTIKRSPANLPFDMTGALWAIGSAVFGIGAYIAFTFALRNGNAGTTTILATTYPVITFLLSAIFLGERITLAKSGGIGMVVLGVMILAR